MQNPFRHQDEPDRPDRERDQRRWEARDQRPDEYRSWAGGDGGRTAEAFRGQGQEPAREPGYGYGQNQQSRYGQGMATGWTGDRGPAYGPGGYSSGAPSYGGQPYGSQTYAGPSYSGQDYGARTYGGQAGMSQGYATHGYAPGAQIWEGSGRGMGGQSHQHHDFEPDYLHWREQQLSAFDKDYSDWRNERRQKFSADFDTWRQNRPRVQAENPIVGDVSDGGDGRGGEQAARKR